LVDGNSGGFKGGALGAIALSPKRIFGFYQQKRLKNKLISGGATGGWGVGSVTPPPNNWEFYLIFPIYKFEKSKYNRDLPTLFQKVQD
jgi:hypothetical protein